MNASSLIRRLAAVGAGVALTAGLGVMGSPSAMAVSSSPSITLSSHTAGEATGVTAQWTTTPSFTYNGGFIQRLQMDGFGTIGASSPTPCSWISYSDAKTAAGCTLFTVSGKVYLDWTAQYNGTVQGTPTTVTVTIPSGYITNPSGAGTYSAYAGDETATGPTLTMSAATNVSIYSSDSSLSSLTCDSCSIAPTFSSGTVNYTSVVSEDVESVSVTPTATDSGATITVNGSAVSSGSPSAALPLGIGSNTISVLVTADDSTTTTYTLTITRGSSPDQTPPTWFQSYGRHDATETCREGWSPSWALWVHGGLGGFTCERRIEWSAQIGGWVTRDGFG